MARDLIPSDATLKAALRKARQQELDQAPIAPRQMSDGDGLYLLLVVKGRVSPAWRFDYSLGTRKTLSLGTYPDTTLASARQKAQAAREMVAAGNDPSQARKRARKAQEQAKEAAARADRGLPPVGSFEAVARELAEAKRGSEWSEAYADRWLRCLELDIFPALGSNPLATVTAPMVLAELRKVEGRGARETAHSLRQYVGQVCKYGIATGRAERNVAADLHGALAKVLVQHAAAATTPEAAGDLLRAIEGYQGHPVTRAALRLSAYLFQRPGNMRTMRWADVDLDAATWTIPSADMKRSIEGKRAGRPHIVPLPDQAVALLADLKPLTGHLVYVFPSLHGAGQPMSENTVNVALRRLGYDNTQATAHGFRAMARTLMVERLDIDPEIVEAQLAHAKRGPLGAAYDRASYVAQRREAMQKYADYLDRLAHPSTKVTPISRGHASR